ncbi:MAG: hypothetical protein ACREM1_18405, partial [Longimicrobiales bacterium]
DYFRQEIGFVDWVRDRNDADVHILITSQETGGGGEAYELDFLGRGSFVGQDVSLPYTSDVTDTEDEVRRGVARTLRLGLASYAAQTASAPRFDIVYESSDEDETGAPLPADREQDPWNLWVFQVGVDGSVEAESQTDEWDFGASFSASRTTPFWKHGFALEVGYTHDSFTFEDDGELRTLTDIRRSFETVATSVRSIGGRWSAGLRSGAATSTQQNLDFEFFSGPAIEYSFFPYDEFTRRQLILLYTVSGNYVNYLEETIFDQSKEMLYRQSLALAFGATQPWGEARASVGGSQYLHDSSKYSVELDGGLEFRIVRGLSLDVSGEVEWIRDQLSLPKEGATPEEVLLNQRELATNYRYELQLGLSFRFGSPFNNIVNPRLDDLDWRF